MLLSLEGHRAAFLAELPVSLAIRRERLHRASLLIEENRDSLCAALVGDGRHPNADAAMVSEIAPALVALGEAQRSVGDWARPTAGRGLLDRLVRGDEHVEYQPIGILGAVAAPLLPVQQTGKLLASALAAGNRVVIKFDATTPRLGRLLEVLTPRYFDPLELMTLSGGPDTDVEFAKLPFDQLVTPAAEDGEGTSPSLPIEHSGKSPAILGRSADFARAAERVIAQKLVRSGRTPQAPDYLLVPVEHEEEIANWLWRAAMHLYPRMPEAAPDAPFSYSERERLQHLIEDARARGAEILVAQPPRDDAMPLHIVRHATDDMLVMQEEIRGPILPLRNFTHIDEAIGDIHRQNPSLAIYYFGRDAEERRYVLDSTLSSTIAIDCCAIGQFSPSGSGASFQGRGDSGFRRFSRIRRVFRKPILDLPVLAGRPEPEQIPATTPVLQ